MLCAKFNLQSERTFQTPCSVMIVNRLASSGETHTSMWGARPFMQLNVITVSLQWRCLFTGSHLISRNAQSIKLKPTFCQAPRQLFTLYSKQLSLQLVALFLAIQGQQDSANLFGNFSWFVFIYPLFWEKIYRSSLTLKTQGPQCQFAENICSEDDLRSKMFERFVAKFLAYLPLLAFSNI